MLRKLKIDEGGERAVMGALVASIMGLAREECQAEMDVCTGANAVSVGISLFVFGMTLVCKYG